MSGGDAGQLRETTYQYDGNGNLIAKIDADRLVSTYDHSRNNAFPAYQYDSLGNLVYEKTGNANSTS